MKMVFRSTHLSGDKKKFCAPYYTRLHLQYVLPFRFSIHRIFTICKKPNSNDTRCFQYQVTHRRRQTRTHQHTHFYIQYLIQCELDLINPTRRRESKLFFLSRSVSLYFILFFPPAIQFFFFIQCVALRWKYVLAIVTTDFWCLCWRFRLDFLPLF